ncbi:Uncharacterised protein [[Clostridium] symbiosum]|uniref:hypothetical protein n=1 Tax=Clostridium symbiosum TaxID=1512 RepID=UPI000E12B900|nr:Uncharacterised protein [[Clostridium] symbiosum]
MYFITTKRMLEVCFSAHPNIQYRTLFSCWLFMWEACLHRFSKMPVQSGLIRLSACIMACFR